MNVELTSHAIELLEAVRARRQEPVEKILERALEAFAHQERIQAQVPSSRERQRDAVRGMLEFVKENRVSVGAGLSVKDLIHQGHRI